MLYVLLNAIVSHFPMKWPNFYLEQIRIRILKCHEEDF